MAGVAKLNGIWYLNMVKVYKGGALKNRLLGNFFKVVTREINNMHFGI